jgi:hypothetical protein
MSEQPIDTAADIVGDHVNGLPGAAVFRPGSTAGRTWLSENFEQFSDGGDGVFVMPWELEDIVSRARRDGLTYEADDGPAKPLPPGADSADVLVTKRCVFSSPMLLVQFLTEAGIRWGVRNRRPDVPGARDRWLCHPQALSTIVAARREGLVVVVEREAR